MAKKLKEYEITLSVTFNVSAKNKEEAKLLAQDEWFDSDGRFSDFDVEVEEF